MLEIVKDPVIVDVINFLVGVIISGILIRNVYLSEEVRKIFLFLLSAWGIIVAVCGVTQAYNDIRIIPDNMFSEILGAIVWGVLGFVSFFILRSRGKVDDKKTDAGSTKGAGNDSEYKEPEIDDNIRIARILATISVVAGLINCFNF